MNLLSTRLAISAGLSLLLLPLGLMINGELSNLSVSGLWVVGTLLGIWPKTFRMFLWAAGICAVFVAVVLSTPLMPRAVNSLVVDQPPQPADLIVILGGGMHCGAGELESSSLARLQRGLQLWKAGYAPRITLSDTVGETYGDSSCASLGLEAQRQVKTLYGENSPEIILLPQMRTTRTEALAVAQIVHERGFKKILLVTAPTHSRRSRSTFRQLGLEVVSVVSAEPRFDMQMQKPVDRILALAPLAREVLGLITYRLRGWLSG